MLLIYVDLMLRKLSLMLNMSCLGVGASQAHMQHDNQCPFYLDKSLLKVSPNKLF